MTDRSDDSSGGSDDLVRRAYGDLTGDAAPGPAAGDEAPPPEPGSDEPALPPPTGLPYRSTPLPPADFAYAAPKPEAPYLPDAHWRLRDALIVFAAGFAAAVVASLVVASTNADTGSGYVVFGLLFPAQVAGSLIAAGVLSAQRGTGNWVRDFGLRLRLREIWGLGGGVGLQIAALIVTGIVITTLGGGSQPDQNVAEVAEQSVGGALVLAFIGTVILAPLVEEVLYRGMLLSTLRRTMTARSAVFVSSAVFAGVHIVDPGTLLLLPGLFVIGVGLGYAALRSKSLSLPLFLHAGVNLTGFVLTQYADELQEWLEDLEQSVEMIMPLLGG